MDPQYETDSAIMRDILSGDFITIFDCPFVQLSSRYQVDNLYVFTSRPNFEKLVFGACIFFKEKKHLI